MGYRMYAYPVFGEGECGGKLYGEIEEEVLHNLPSWKWLVSHGYVDNSDGVDFCSCGGYNHTIMFKDEFLEFIKLYVDDFNEYWKPKAKEGKLSLDDFEECLSAERVCMEWF